MKQHCLKLLGFLSSRKSDFVIILDFLWWTLSIDYKNSFQYAQCSEIYKQRKTMVPVSFVNMQLLVRWNIIMHNEDKWQFQMALLLEVS